MVAVLLPVLSAGAMAEEAAAPATVSPAEADENTCYDLCIRALSRKLDPQAQEELQACMLVRPCIPWVLGPPPHGIPANHDGMPAIHAPDMERALDAIMKTLRGSIS